MLTWIFGLAIVAFIGLLWYIYQEDGYVDEEYVGAALVAALLTGLVLWAILGLVVLIFRLDDDIMFTFTKPTVVQVWTLGRIGVIIAGMYSYNKAYTGRGRLKSLGAILFSEIFLAFYILRGVYYILELIVKLLLWFLGLFDGLFKALGKVWQQTIIDIKNELKD